MPALPLNEGGDAGSDPIQILDAKGLEPVKAAITTTPFGAFDGEAFVGSTIGKRNIVLSIGLNPDWSIQSIEELRQLLYNYFMPKLLVELRFHSTNFPTTRIQGYVESMDPNIFAKNPTIEVSIICPIPDFIAIDETTVTGITNDGTSLTEIEYIGSVSAGLELKVTQAVGTPGEDSIQLNVVSENLPQSFVARGNLTPDIRWEMSTLMSSKYVRSVSQSLGTITNYLNNVAFDAVWPRLQPGVNKVAVVTPVVGQNWELTYHARFGGL
jgi:hypothetical protein